MEIWCEARSLPSGHSFCPLRALSAVVGNSLPVIVIATVKISWHSSGYCIRTSVTLGNVFAKKITANCPLFNTKKVLKKHPSFCNLRGISREMPELSTPKPGCFKAKQRGMTCVGTLHRGPTLDWESH